MRRASTHRFSAQPQRVRPRQPASGVSFGCERVPVHGESAAPSTVAPAPSGSLGRSMRSWMAGTASRTAPRAVLMIAPPVDSTSTEPGPAPAAP